MPADSPTLYDFCSATFGGYPGQWVAAEVHAEVLARVAELEAALEEAEIEVSVAAHRLHFEDIALVPDRADELAELCERLRDALKGDGAR